MIKIRILQKHYIANIKSKENYQGFYILFIKIKRYGIGWFTDCGEWFLYFYLGKKHCVRFSSAGHFIY